MIVNLVSNGGPFPRAWRESEAAVRVGVGT